MEEGVVAAMLEHPQLFAKSDQLSLVIKEESLLDVIRVCRKMAEVDGVLDGATLLAALAGNPASSWVEKKLVESPREVASAEHAVAVGYSSLVKKDLIRRAKRLGAECTEAFERGDEEFALSLSRQRTALQQLANRIRGAAPLSEELQEAYQALCLPVQRSSESSIQ